MPSEPMSGPRESLKTAPEVHQEKIDPLYRICYIPTPYGWASLVILLATRHAWAVRWLISGAPVFSFLILLGASKGNRVLPFLHVWTLFATLNLVYAVAGTSWLLYFFYTAFCWPSNILAAITQFDAAAGFVRRGLRKLLYQFDFIQDKIAFFDIPALEIDTEVAGLMVIRGLTFSISTLTVEAHGIEVGIKLSDDMELAIQTELCTISFFRGIKVSECFANLKGGAYEMTFGELDEITEDADGNALMNTDTALLRAASAGLDGYMSPPEKIKMTDYMTAGKDPEPLSADDGLDAVKPMPLTDQNAVAKYKERMNEIRNTSHITKTRNRLKRGENEEYLANDKSLRAAICSHLHDKPSVPHPPKRSVRVTTLQKMGPAWLKRFEHRLPLLLRALLNPLSYFHPIDISSITATASGAWIKSLLLDKIFKDYADNDRDLRNLRDRMLAWLADANFAFEMDNITGLAQVPINTDYDIKCLLGIKDVITYRTIPKQVSLHEVVRLGGADASFTIPSFLLPHHEHILPPIPTAQDKKDIQYDIDNADGRPQKIQAEHEMKQAIKDETNVQMSVHARLPACFDQTLLDFIAALVKATKIIEMEKDSGDALDPEVRSFKGFAKSITAAGKDGMKKAMVGGIVNDRWIAKLVGKVTKALETAQGDVGYSGSIPVPLAPYRERGVGEASKLLP